MVKIPIGMGPVIIQIAMLRGMVTQNARQQGGQRMGWTMSMLDGCGRMDFAITEVAANRVHACVRAWATLLVRQFRMLGINSRAPCLLRSWKTIILMLLCVTKISFLVGKEV